MRHVPRYFWQFATLCVATLGCGRFDRTRECRMLTQAVNESHAEVAVLADAAVPDKKSIAERYFRVAEGIREMKFSSPGLQKAAQDYSTLMEDTGLALDKDREMPPRADGKPRPRPSLQHIPRRERTLVARINAMCESP